MFRADATPKPIHDASLPLVGISLQRFRRMRTSARIRKLLTWPIRALRKAMLKLALATGSLEGLTLEAVPAFWQEDSVHARYIACIRTRKDEVRLVVDGTVQRSFYHGTPAVTVTIGKITIPYYAIKASRFEPE